METKGSSRERLEREAYEAFQRKLSDRETLERKRPPKVQALIVAELAQDDCDCQTDYFATKTMRTVAIGWRTGKREDFRQLRKAAAGFPETAHLGPGLDVWTVRAVWTTNHPTGAFWEGSQVPCHFLDDVMGERCFDYPKFGTEAEVNAYVEAHPLDNWSIGMEGETGRAKWVIGRQSIEHRERYSMGHGLYLKATCRYSSGWEVRSFPWPCTWLNAIEDCIPEPCAAPRNGKRPAPAVTGPVTITENEERDGVELRFPDKPDEAIRTQLKSNGWRWSRHHVCWYQRRSAEVLAFARSLGEAVSHA